MRVAKAIDFVSDRHHESQRKKAKTRPEKNQSGQKSGETEKMNRWLALRRIPVGKTNLITWSPK